MLTFSFPCLSYVRHKLWSAFYSSILTNRIARDKTPDHIHKKESMPQAGIPGRKRNKSVRSLCLYIGRGECIAQGAIMIRKRNHCTLIITRNPSLCCRPLMARRPNCYSLLSSSDRWIQPWERNGLGMRVRTWAARTHKSRGKRLSILPLYSCSPARRSRPHQDFLITPRRDRGLISSIFPSHLIFSGEEEKVIPVSAGGRRRQSSLAL